jgi:hypothetical protein
MGGNVFYSKQGGGATGSRIGNAPLDAGNKRVRQSLNVVHLQQIPAIQQPLFRGVIIWTFPGRSHWR